MGLAMLRPRPIVGQVAERPSVDTIPLALLPAATVVRREVPHSCFDCWSSFATDISLDEVTVQVRHVDDLPMVWKLLAPIPDSAGAEALRLRLLQLLEATFLPDASPHLVAGSADLDARLLRFVEPRDGMGP